MKKWYLLSIPLIGLASISVWGQANAGPPAVRHPGVVVEDRSGQGTGLEVDGSASSPAPAPTSTAARTSPSASATPAKTTTPTLPGSVPPLNPDSPTSRIFPAAPPGDDDSDNLKHVDEWLVTSPPTPASLTDGGGGSGGGSGSSGGGSSNGGSGGGSSSGKNG